MNLRYLALLPVAVLTALIFVTLFFDFSTMFVLNPPYLLLELNLIFWTIATLAIAFISSKSFIKDDSQPVLLLSSSIIIFGFSVIISGWVGSFSGNYSVAIGNICILVASMVQVLGSIFSFIGKTKTNIVKRTAFLAAVYLASVVFVVAVSAIVLLGYIPDFFTSSGPTLLRQGILGSAVFLFAVAATIFGVQYMKSKSPSLYWYAIAIGLFSIGLFSAFEVKTLGDIPTWLGRIALYAGTFYLIAAILASRQKSGAGIALAGAWAEAFGSDRSQIANFFSKMLNGFAYHRIVVDASGKPIDYVFLEINGPFEKMTGLKKEEIIGRKVTEVLAGIEKDPADWIGVYGRVALSGESIQFENYAEPLSKWFHISAYSPQKEYFIALFEDITDRKRAEEALRRQAALLDLSPDAIMVRSFEGNISDWSGGAERLYGYSKEEVLGKISHQLLKTKFPMPLAEIDAQINRTGEWSGELVHKTKSGLELIVQSRWLVKKFKQENISIFESNIDITEQKKAEEKLRESKVWEATSFYTRNLIEASLDPLVTISAEGKITDVNKATELATGSTREELVGSDFSNYFTEPEKAKVGYKRVFTDGFVRDYPLAIRHKSGKITDVLYNATVYRSESGEIQGVFAAARDITELKRAEEQAQESAKKLKDAERLAAIGATAGMVGHDIRNPLQAITSDIYLVKTDLASFPETEEKKNVQESLGEIEKNIYYINKIVADLQDFARPLTPKIEEIDLEKTIHSALAHLNIPGNVTVKHSIRKDFPKLKADQTYIQRILTNLSNNAMQAMPNGGKLTIAAATKNGKAIISVEDNGEGIPESIRSKLFIPLVTTKSKGQGFGLSVVKRFTEALGGTVTFESEVGKGTKFIVELPL